MISVSVLSCGVQVVATNPGMMPLPKKQYLPGDPLWLFLTDLSFRRFGSLPELRGHRLVSVDVNGREAQWSFHKEPFHADQEVPSERSDPPEET